MRRTVVEQTRHRRREIGHRLAGRHPGIRFAAAAPFLPDDPVIIEAGASTGHDVLELLKLWPRATVHAFEPEPATYRELVSNVRSLPNVKTWELALAATSGTATLNVSSGDYGTASSSLLEPMLVRAELPGLRFEQVNVEQVTLGDWCQRNGIGRCDFLALDMQGLECGMLSASRDVLRGVRVVIAEAFTEELYAGAGTVLDLHRILAEEGFVILHTNTYWGTTLDIIAVSMAALTEAVRRGGHADGSLDYF